MDKRLIRSFENPGDCPVLFRDFGPGFFGNVRRRRWLIQESEVLGHDEGGFFGGVSGVLFSDDLKGIEDISTEAMIENLIPDLEEFLVGLFPGIDHPGVQHQFSGDNGYFRMDHLTQVIDHHFQALILFGFQFGNILPNDFELPAQLFGVGRFPIGILCEREVGIPVNRGGFYGEGSTLENGEVGSFSSHNINIIRQRRLFWKEKI